MPTITSLQADGFVSTIVTLSDGSSVVLLAAGGGSIAGNSALRNTFIAALKATVPAITEFAPRDHQPDPVELEIA